MTLCATASREWDEPVAGTAAVARTWLLVEQPGPWGAKALTGSRLDPGLGRALDAAAAGSGVRVALIRRPGRHPVGPGTASRTVYAASADPAHPWVHAAHAADPAALLDLDFGALGAGEHRGFDRLLCGGPHAGAPLAFVCTNGRRDRCCAALGRPLAQELAASGHEGIWEVTHLGGHRFAPTVLVLPFGYAYGRVGGADVKDILREARLGRVVLDGCRGNSTWPRPAQAAELALRARLGEHTAGALRVLAVEGGAPAWAVTLAHTDGRRWRVDVAEGPAGPPRPESCGAALGTPATMTPGAPRELAPDTAGTG
ncbi:sucrase ferredoxin [Streptomyces sp. NPDC050560]|uniref:sucrase ferredoxin n=1 Tax=Streptomyces sp. NPDC050560 TaxID=3365630 RepID=UPI00378E7C75